MARTAPRKAAPKTAKSAKAPAKAKAAKKASRRKVAVPEPGSDAPDAAPLYLEMTKVLMAALPPRGRVTAQDTLFEAARNGTTRRQFPGDTHRMWAEHVLADLQAKGVLARDADGRWRRA